MLVGIKGSAISDKGDLRRSPDAPGTDESKGKAVKSDTAITVPHNLSVVRDDGRLTVEWTAPDGDSHTGYRVEWKRTSQNWAASSSATVSATAQAYTITGLANRSSHDVRVAPQLNVGIGDWSAKVSATPAPLPGSPRDLEAGGLHDRLKASWDPPDQTNGQTVTGYLFQWKAGGGAL